MVVIIGMVLNDFSVKKELLKLLSLQERTRGEDIYDIFKNYSAESNIQFLYETDVGRFIYCLQKTNRSVRHTCCSYVVRDAILCVLVGQFSSPRRLQQHGTNCHAKFINSRFKHTEFCTTFDTVPKRLSTDE